MFAFLLEGLRELVDVLVYVLKDEVGVCVVPDELLEFDDVGVHELAQCLDLRQLQALVPGWVLLLQLLYSYYLVGVSILGLLHAAEGPTAQLRYHPILLHIQMHYSNHLPRPTSDRRVPVTVFLRKTRKSYRNSMLIARWSALPASYYTLHSFVLYAIMKKNRATPP